jgi:WD40 repeat protein
VDGSICAWFADGRQEAFTLQGHAHSVCCVDLNGQSSLVSGGTDNHVKVWTLSNGGAPVLIHTLTGHIGEVYAVKFSPDGKKIASGSRDMTIMTWCVQSGLQLRTLRGHEGSIRCIAWTPDSKFVISGGFDKTVRVWDALAGKQAMKPLTGLYDVRCIVLNATASVMITASTDKAIEIWDCAFSKRKEATLRHTVQGDKGRTGQWMSISLSPDERFLVSSGYGRALHIWEVATAQKVRVLEGHTAYISSVSWSREGDYIVSSSWDQSVCVWEAHEKVVHVC